MVSSRSYDGSRPVLSVFSPEEMSTQWEFSAMQTARDSASHTRIVNPGVGGTPAPTAANSPAEILAQTRDRDRDDVPRLTDAERDAFRSTRSLGDFYRTVIEPWRCRQKGRNQVAAGTLTNERQAVRCFEQFDQVNPPDGWPQDVAWNGMPVGFLVAKRVRDWLAYRLEFGTDTGPLSAGSLPKRWNHLRTIINHAVRLGILAEKVSVSVPQLIDAYLTESGTVDDSDLIPTSFTECQLNAVYLQLIGELELQTAWVLGATIGPRTADLFALRWGRNVRLNADPPDVVFVAQKTKRKRRRIWVPLGPLTLRHLRLLARQQSHVDPNNPEGLVFPSLTDSQRIDPEDGDRSRARTRRIKSAMIAAGIPSTADTERPWQMLRTTVNSRLNDMEFPAGDRATHGKADTVQGAFYTDYKQLLIAAVNKLDAQRLDAGIFCS